MTNNSNLKFIVPLVLLILIVGGGAYYFLNSSSASSTTTSNIVKSNETKVDFPFPLTTDAYNVNDSSVDKMKIYSYNTKLTQEQFITYYTEIANQKGFTITNSAPVAGTKTYSLYFNGIYNQKPTNVMFAYTVLENGDIAVGASSWETQ